LIIVPKKEKDRKQASLVKGEILSQASVPCKVALLAGQAHTQAVKEVQNLSFSL
jgi:hypothetical protein